MGKNKKRWFRNKSLRWEKWNYSWRGLYFITICTREKQTFFGEVKNSNIDLSLDGKISQQILNLIPSQFLFIKLSDHIIMPNHIHLILNLYEWAECKSIDEKKGGITGAKNPMLHNNIPRVVRWFKGRATFEIRKNNPYFSWQRKYYDRIIRNKLELKNVIQYIENNPLEWEYIYGMQIPKNKEL
jgi:REP element-mobilizing transposase RayT